MDATGASDATPARSLGVVMGLPLVDGVFATLVVTGGLDSVTGILEVGLLVFGGAATTALLLASEADRRADVHRVLTIGVPVLALAAAEAAVAPSLLALLDAEAFRPFAGLVLVAVAARVAAAHVTRYLPAPGLVVLVGVVVSFDPGGSLALQPDPEVATRALAAAGVGVGSALAVVLARPRLRRVLDPERFRIGSAVALGTMGASVAGLVPQGSPLPLAAFVLAVVLALEPRSGGDRDPSTP